MRPNLSSRLVTACLAGWLVTSPLARAQDASRPSDRAILGGIPALGSPVGEGDSSIFPGLAAPDPARMFSAIPSPPSILGQEVRPIDLTSALRLAGGRKSRAEPGSAAGAGSGRLADVRAAAQLLPTINYGTNYDSHTGVLQQSNGNILSVNRSAVYVGAGANAVAAGTVNIPGVFLGGNIGQGALRLSDEPAGGDSTRGGDDRDPEPGLSPGNAQLRGVAPGRGNPGGRAPVARRGPRGRQADGRLRGDGSGA